MDINVKQHMRRELRINGNTISRRDQVKLVRPKWGHIEFLGKVWSTREVRAVLVNSACDARNTASFDMARAFPDMTITRKAARALGLSIYRTGISCPHGHVAWRYVSSGNCVECCATVRKL